MKIIFILILVIVIENIVSKIKYNYINKKKVLNIDLSIINESYPLNRFKRALEWYEKKAYLYRNQYYLYSFLVIIISALIPVISLLNRDFYFYESKEAVAYLSVCVTIISGYLLLGKQKEKWIDYRQHAEKLKNALSKKYYKNQTNQEFLEQVEEILKQENNNWFEKRKKEEKSQSKMTSKGNVIY